jgi:hypothetical protein
LVQAEGDEDTTFPVQFYCWGFYRRGLATATMMMMMVCVKAGEEQTLGDVVDGWTP